MEFLLPSSSQTTVENQRKDEHIIDIADVNEDQHGSSERKSPTDSNPNAIAGADEPFDLSRKGRFRLWFNRLGCVVTYFEKYV